jgi:hypothetical protein
VQGPGSRRRRRADFSPLVSIRLPAARPAPRLHLHGRSPSRRAWQSSSKVALRRLVPWQALCSPAPTPALSETGARESLTI